MIVPRILIIDDEYGKDSEERRKLCKICNIVEKEDEVNDKTVAIATFLSGQKQIKDDKYRNMDLDEIASIVKKGWEKYPRWALVFIDLFFDTGKFTEDKELFGFEIVNKILGDTYTKDIPIVILSSIERNGIEREISESGTFKFVDKSINKRILEDVLNEIGLVEDDEAIGHSIDWLKCLREARRSALRGNEGKQENVLIIGETGTGKNILASYIYKKSDRKKSKYIERNLSEVPYETVDSYIFGHARGAFTGADYDQMGAAEEADKGVLFIDEIGDIPLNIQNKIKRLLDKNQRTTQRIGSVNQKKVDLIVIAATNKDYVLDDSDRFGRDIIARLGDPIILPPLRKRPEDVIPLTEYFVRKYEQLYEAEQRTINEKAKTLIEKYEWPENTRELETKISKAVFDYKNIRHLDARHLRINIANIERTIYSQKEGMDIRGEKKEEIESISEIANIMMKMSEKDFEVKRGDYARYERADSIITKKMLKKALEITRRRGKISYLDAIRHLKDNDEIKNAQARNIFNRIKGIGEKFGDCSNDPIFKEMEAEKEKKRKKKKMSE